MAKNYEFYTFVNKFLNLWNAGENAFLSVECCDGKAIANIQLKLERPPPAPPPPARPPHPNHKPYPPSPRRPGQSRLQRSARRAQARAAAAEAVAAATSPSAEEDHENATQDTEEVSQDHETTPTDAEDAVEIISTPTTDAAVQADFHLEAEQAAPQAVCPGQVSQSNIRDNINFLIKKVFLSLATLTS